MRSQKNMSAFVSAVCKVSQRLYHYGDANVINVNLLGLIYNYAPYSTTYEQLQQFDTLLSDLQTGAGGFGGNGSGGLGGLDGLGVVGGGTNGGGIDVPIEVSDDVNNVGNAGSDDPLDDNDPDSGGPNDPDGDVITVIIDDGTIDNYPTITASAITVTDSMTTYTFANSEIHNGWTSPRAADPGSFVLKTLPANGTLTYDGSAVVINTLYADPTLLVYIRNSDTSYGTTFNWSVFDDDEQLPLESNTVTMTVTVEAIILENEPATLGDRAVYPLNRAVTVFSVADFTTETIAPYFDPEGNDLDAIRIDEISDANTGVYFFYGDPVVIGQVITNAELAQGAFYHVAPDTNDVTTDSFNASVRDDGSMIWVQ